jgi:hypothetical protein
MYVSHETIYRTLFIQARGALKKELVAHLRSHRTMRRARHTSLRGKGRGQIRDAVSIRERPPEVEDRAVPGHWEGDLLFGSKRTQIATLVERRSRFTILVKLDGRDATTVTEALEKQIIKLPAHLRRSLTWDRGLEMANHADFTVATGVDVYFDYQCCRQNRPWKPTEGRTFLLRAVGRCFMLPIRARSVMVRCSASWCLGAASTLLLVASACPGGGGGDDTGTGNEGGGSGEVGTDEDSDGDGEVGEESGEGGGSG